MAVTPPPADQFLDTQGFRNDAVVYFPLRLPLSRYPIASLAACAATMRVTATPPDRRTGNKAQQRWMLLFFIRLSLLPFSPSNPLPAWQSVRPR